jgi:hypothetical protein
LEPIVDPIEWSDFVIHIAVPLVLFLLAWLIKQGRDARLQMSAGINESKESMNEAVGTLTAAVDAVKTELQQYRETWIERRESLIDIITKHCNENMGACRALVDLQLGSLKEGQEHVCNKIDELKKSENTKWEKQEEFNLKLVTHINDKTIHKKEL